MKTFVYNASDWEIFKDGKNYSQENLNVGESNLEPYKKICSF